MLLVGINPAGDGSGIGSDAWGQDQPRGDIDRLAVQVFNHHLHTGTLTTGQLQTVRLKPDPIGPAFFLVLLVDQAR